MGYIKRDGSCLVPAQFDDAYDFDGLGVVKIGQKYGVVNKKGEYLIKPVQDEIYSIDGTNRNYGIFKDGRIIVAFSDGKYGLLKNDGSWAVEPQDEYYLG